MRIVIVISMMVACTMAQGLFGGGGFVNPLPFGGAAVSQVSNLAGDIASGIPGLSSVRTFADFVVNINWYRKF